ncbi:MAG: sodium:proton antiporter [Gammaproteobacteria bacterium]
MEHSIGASIAIVTALGIGAQWLAWKVRLPSILLLSIVGLLAGPVFGVLDPAADFGDFLQPIIGLCVAVILFEGGLNLEFHELKIAASGVRRLVFVGAPLAWFLGSLAAHYIGGLSWPVALVFGSIIVVTGPTVIIPMLRHAMLNKRTASYLKWEAIINDPIGALLAVLVFQYFVFSGVGAAHDQVFYNLGRALIVSLILGIPAGLALGILFRRGMVPEYLKSPMTLATVLGVYTLSNAAQQEAGLLAVTGMGIVMGNMGLPSIEEMRRFKEYITILLVSVVFILLAADLEPATLARMDLRSLALVFAVMFLVRPLTVFPATVGVGMDLRDRALLSWIAPRGIVAAAVAGVFAPRMIDAGYADAELLVPLIFSLIFATVTLHSTSLGYISRLMGLASKTGNRVLIVGVSPWTTELAKVLRDVDISVLLVDSSWHRLRDARMKGIPVYYGEILSDAAEESLELNDVGVLLAATSNDAYNSLVCTAFASELGRSKVFQLPMYDTDDDDPRGVARTMRGRIAFSDSAYYERLWRQLTKGWQFHKSKITENYDSATYLDECADDMMQLLVKRQEGGIQFGSSQEPLAFKSGDTVIAFGPEKQESLQKILSQPNDEAAPESPVS